LKHALLELTALALLLVGLARFEGEGPPLRAPLRAIWLAGFAVFAVFEVRNLLRIASDNLAHVPLWDFRVFWMVGRAAVEHRDVYDPASFTSFASSLNPGHDPLFDAVALGVGLPYPPPSLFLFFPLGWFGLGTALLLWYVAMGVALTIACIMLSRLFFRESGPAGWFAPALLLLLLPQTGVTLALAQINFFALVFSIAYWRERIAWRAGAWLAPFAILRPPGLALALEAIAKSRRGLAIGLVAASAALFLAAIPLAGARAMTTYLRANPSSHYPESFFPGYQSLYQLFALRDTSHAGYFSLAAHPAYVACALGLFAGAAWIAARAAPERAGMVRAMLLTLGLFVYPSTGAHYAVLLVLPLCELWRGRRALGLGTAGAIAVFEVNYALLRVGDAATTIGLLLVIDTAIFAALALRR
jgi:hypothetical protein